MVHSRGRVEARTVQTPAAEVPAQVKAAAAIAVREIAEPVGHDVDAASHHAGRHAGPDQHDPDVAGVQQLGEISGQASARLDAAPAQPLLRSSRLPLDRHKSFGRARRPPRPSRHLRRALWSAPGGHPSDPRGSLVRVRTRSTDPGGWCRTTQGRGLENREYRDFGRRLKERPKEIS